VRSGLTLSAKAPAGGLTFAVLLIVGKEASEKEA
jgi:hypothetical protein